MQHWRSRVNTLEQWLHEQSRSARDLYLMLDSDGQLDERVALARELGADQYRSVYSGTVAGALAPSGPFLFRVGSVKHPVIQALLATPERHWGWLASASHVDLDILTGHWRNRLITGARPSLAVFACTITACWAAPSPTCNRNSARAFSARSPASVTGTLNNGR